MKLTARLLILIVSLALFVSGCGSSSSQNNTQLPPDNGQPAAVSGNGKVVFPRTVKDGQGNAVTISHEPIRIVSVTLATDEILFGLVNYAHIVAITANAADPVQSNIAPLASRIKIHLAKADPEAIIGLQPDLVFVASYTDAGVIKQLKDANLSVFVVGSFKSIKDIENNIKLIGAAVGQEQGADSLVIAMEAKLQAISQAIKGANSSTVLYYAPGGTSDGPGTIIDDIITRAGGTNAVTAGGIKDLFPQLNDEFVVKQNPSFILLAGFNSYAPGFVDNFAKNPNFQTLDALKNKHAIIVNDAHVAAVSQYVVEGVADVAAIIHPGVYNAETVKNLSATIEAKLSPTEGAQ
jgi:iron complex transport system substrate-binding protein